MASPHVSHPQVMARPAGTPAAIRNVPAANAGPEVLRRYDDELDAAFQEAREHGGCAHSTASEACTDGSWRLPKCPSTWRSVPTGTRRNLTG
jgi:hypothetical protein